MWRYGRHPIFDGEIIGRGEEEKKEDRKKSQDKNIMTASVTQGGHNNSASIRQAVFPDINNACREQMLS